MRPAQAPDDPLVQNVAEPVQDDPVLTRWFLEEDERDNPGTDLRPYTTGNQVRPLVDGRTYFARLCQELQATGPGDEIYFLDFRGDMTERLAGPGTEVGRLLEAAARRGAQVFGLLWRSQPRLLHQSEEENAEFARELDEAGGQVLLDSRTRRAGSHHQKLVVIRRRRREDDVAFVGGIDLGFSRNDDGDHLGDQQPMEFPDIYGPRPAWHDIQAEVRGPAIHDLEHSFRERWYGSSVLDIPSPIRQLVDRAYHMGAMTGRPLPEPIDDDSNEPGQHAVQVLRTYPARWRRYPFAPLGERSIAHAYRKALANARRIVYLEDQYLWSGLVADVFAEALIRNPELKMVVVVPRYPDHQSGLTRLPSLVGRQEAMRTIAAAGGDRFAVYDIENQVGTPVYVHAKVVVVDDVWAMIGSDNLNRRSWTHDSELSIAVVDQELDDRDPRDPGGLGDHARRFARDLRLQLSAEHLDRSPDDLDDLLDPDEAFDAFARQAQALDEWYAGGRRGSRPPGRVRRHRPGGVGSLHRLWATPIYRVLHDPDGRPWRDRLRRRP